jgi:hypothetical protein
MIRNETTAADGTVIRVEIIDDDAGTYVLEEHGVLVEARSLTPADIASYVAAYAPEPEPPTVEDRLAALEAEVRTVKDRAAALEAASTRSDSRRN